MLSKVLFIHPRQINQIMAANSHTCVPLPVSSAQDGENKEEDGSSSARKFFSKSELEKDTSLPSTKGSGGSYNYEEGSSRGSRQHRKTASTASDLDSVAPKLAKRGSVEFILPSDGEGDTGGQSHKLELHQSHMEEPAAASVPEPEVVESGNCLSFLSCFSTKTSGALSKPGHSVRSNKNLSTSDLSGRQKSLQTLHQKLRQMSSSAGLNGESSPPNPASSKTFVSTQNVRQVSRG